MRVGQNSPRLVDVFADLVRKAEECSHRGGESELENGHDVTDLLDLLVYRTTN